MRVVVADDAVLLREGLVRLLTENGHEVVAVVGDGPSLVQAVVAHRPDVSIVDVRMPPSHTDEGLRAAVEARQVVPGSPVLVLSQYVEVSYADDLLADRRGGVGYLLKDRVAEITDFLDALARVATGGTVLDPEVIAQLVARRGPLDALTPREREVLALMAEGRSRRRARLAAAQEELAAVLGGMVLPVREAGVPVVELDRPGLVVRTGVARDSRRWIRIPVPDGKRFGGRRPARGVDLRPDMLTVWVSADLDAAAVGTAVDNAVILARTLALPA